MPIESESNENHNPQFSFLKIDSTQKIKTYALPIIVKNKDTSFSLSDGGHSIGNGTWITRGDTLETHISSIFFFPGEERKTNISNTFSLKKDTLTSGDEDSKLTRISKKKFNEWMTKWGNPN